MFSERNIVWTKIYKILSEENSFSVKVVILVRHNYVKSLTVILDFSGVFKSTLYFVRPSPPTPPRRKQVLEDW